MLLNVIVKLYLVCKLYIIGNKTLIKLLFVVVCLLHF